MSDLARKLAEHPRWEWKPGTAVCASDGSSDVVAWVEGGWLNCGYESKRGGGWIRYQVAREPVPDIEHPATKGWLLAMLREVTGDESAFVRPDDLTGRPEACWLEGFDAVSYGADTEGEALAKALLAAWGDE